MRGCAVCGAVSESVCCLWSCVSESVLFVEQ